MMAVSVGDLSYLKSDFQNTESQIKGSFGKELEIRNFVKILRTYGLAIVKNDIVV
jgi:hypothetical protein